MKKLVFLSKNNQETRSLGRFLARAIGCRKLPFRSFIVGLEGDLGSGKTTFTQGFAKGLGIKEKILSPTFVIAKRFTIRKCFWKNFFHIDLYRLKSKREVKKLNWDQILNNKNSIVLIEWADKAKNFLPKNILWVNFKHCSEKEREVIFKA